MIDFYLSFLFFGIAKAFKHDILFSGGEGMKNILKKCSILLVFICSIVLFGMTNVHAEETFTITIDPNGGIEGKNFQSTIVLVDGANQAVSGLDEDFLKAPEGKGFAGIEMIDKNGEVVGIADSVLLWGDSEHEDMTLKFHWGDFISDIGLNVKYPNVGDETTTPEDEYGYYDTNQQTNKPVVTANSDYDFEVQYVEWVDKDSFNEEYEYYEDPYIGTFESGNKYYLCVDLYNNSLNYAFDIDSLNITVNGEKANVYKVVGYSTYMSITLEIELEGTTREVIEGADQTYVVDNNKEATFRIDADYSLFKDGGKVYVDDNLVDSSNYTSKEGSTIITLLKSFVDTLAPGSHTLKVQFNDDSVATTSFTVANMPEEKTEAIAIPNTTINGPETIDNIVLYVFMLALGLFGLGGTVILNKNN